ncbi:hypothetical protein CHS0354_004341 [Potamilus streckersoni]|uniref:Uncharacterized protein n=1 Tax=Potamilus streckersoni TaxID=2493646 RepID=A0AAE0SFV0_9BIVA|nr:hypothetical protein CHS0354_004341 [Potamilus streckersoni]
MKKYARYRFGDPGSRSFFTRYGSLLYFFGAWNVFAITLYYIWKRKKIKEDPEFAKKSSSQIYLELIGYKNLDKDIHKITLKGLNFKGAYNQMKEKKEKDMKETNQDEQ